MLMKKLFTLAALAAMTLVANAQNEYWTVANEDGSRKAEYDVVGATGEASVVKFSTANVTGTHVSGPVANFKDAEGLTGVQDGDLAKNFLEIDYNNTWGNLSKKDLCADGSEKPFYYVQGKGNPVNLDLVKIEQVMTDGEPTGRWRANWNDSYYQFDGSAGIPANGTYVTVSPSIDGIMTVACWINKGSRDVYVVPASNAVALKLGSDVLVHGFINGQNWKTPEGDDLPEGDPYRGYPMYQDNISTKGTEGTDAFVVGAGNQASWVYLTWKAVAKETYYIFNKNTQIGFGGFEFAPTGTDAIKNVETVAKNEVAVNLAGQKVAKNFKGIVVKNGKKVLVK